MVLRSCFRAFLTCGWTPAYRGEEKGRGWVEKVLGWSVDLVERPRKAAPEAVLKSWAEQWEKEGVEVDWENLLPRHLKASRSYLVAG
jgi:hypothetical protein